MRRLGNRVSDIGSKAEQGNSREYWRKRQDIGGRGYWRKRILAEEDAGGKR
jgi:hypothetical protein